MSNRAEKNAGKVYGCSPVKLSRRRAVKGIGKLAAAVALPFGIANDVFAQTANRGALASPSLASTVDSSAAELPVSELMSRFSSYVSQSGDRPLPPDVIEKTKWAVLDGFAAMVSGAQLPGGRAAIRFSLESGGRPISTVIGSQIVCDPITAALANGTMGHSDETDDVLTGPWHPGCNVIPAAFALGEKFGISGSHFLRAVAVGYDVGTRVMKATAVKMNFRAPTNSMGGNWGAAAAAICAANLNEEQTRWALAYTAQQCSGIDDFRRDPRHIEKGFMDGGMGARNGVTSALLVLSGFDAVNDILSGDVSFFSAYADTASPELLVDKLGEDYYVTRAIYKHWPTGLPISAPLDALRVLLERGPIDPKKIREVVVTYVSPGSITDNSGPPDINLQHAVALMLADGRITFNSIHDYTRMKDPEIIRLRSIIKIASRAGEPEAMIGSSGKLSSTAPAIQIKMADGKQLVQEAVAPGPGTADAPYTREWIVGKARSLITPVLGKVQTEKLIETVLGLENQPDIRVLGPLLRADADLPPKLSDWPMA